VSVDGAAGSEPAGAEQLGASLAEQGVEGVALTFVDNSGITRVKTVPPARLAGVVQEGVGMSPVFDAFGIDDSITESRVSGGPVGDLRLYPDLGRLVVLSAQPGWAWAPVDRLTQARQVHPGCQRAFARRMVERLESVGLRASMAFEVEWILGADRGEGSGASGAVGGSGGGGGGGGAGHWGGSFVPATEAPGYGMSRVVELSDYAAELLAALREEGVLVQQFHPEYAPGQFEVSVAPSDPVGAADDSVLVRQTLRAVGERAELRTSFAPVVVAGGVGNGAHLHMSLWRAGANLMTGGRGPHGLTAEAESFLAGVLEHLPSLAALSVPSVASYLRLEPRMWAGAYQAWGLENREAAMRLVTGTAGTEGRSANVELKLVDGSANPYLVVGAVLALGMAGVERGARLGPELSVDPASLGEADLEGLGVRRLPANLNEALGHYERDRVLAEAMGEQLFEAFGAARKAEAERFEGATAEHVVAATRWRH
jgi:glutamine synthetase